MASIQEEPEPRSSSVRDLRNNPRPPESIQLMQELLAILKRSTIVPQDIVDGWGRFWNTYKKEADEYDLEFLSRYREDMNTCMIFAGLFTAVTATVASMTISDLGSDPNQTTQVLLMNILLVLNSTSGLPPQAIPLPTSDRPAVTIIWYQSLLYASLACSLFAALGAMMGIQWLSRYSSVGERGTLEDRCKERQRKLDALEVWHLRRVLDGLSTLLQLSLFLFGVAVCAYMWTQQIIVAAVLIGVMGAGTLFYFLTVGLSVIYRDCPFSTPFSESLRQEVEVGMRVFMSLPNIAKSLAKRYPAPFARPDDPKDFDSTRSPSVAWILATSTDPEIRLDTLLLFPHIDWTLETLQETLSVDMLDLLLDPLVRCFVCGSDGRLRLPPTNDQRAAQLCNAFLFIYWELHVLDARAASCWILRSGRCFVKEHSRILDFLKSSSTGADHNDKHLQLRLMFLTLQSHLDKLWLCVEGTEPRPGELQPHGDDLWRALQEQWPSHIIPLTGHSRLPAPSFHPLILFLLAQMSHWGEWQLENKRLLRSAISHYCKLGTLTKEQIIMCILAFAIALGYELEVEGDVPLGTTMALLERQVNASAMYTLLKPTKLLEQRNLNELEIIPTCHLLEDIVAVYLPSIRLLRCLRSPDIASHLLKLCTFMDVSLGQAVQHERITVSRYIQMFAGLLRLVIHSGIATDSEFPCSLSPDGWTPDPSYLMWLPAFLEKLRSLSHVQSGTLCEGEVQHAAADALLLLAREGNIGPTGEDELLDVFDWVIGLPFPANWSPDTNQRPTGIFRLQATMIRTYMVDTAIIRYTSNFTSQLRTRIIPPLSSVVAQPARSLSKSKSEDSKAIYERDKAFIATLVSLTPESSANESWFNDLANDGYVRAWVRIIHRWSIPYPNNLDSIRFRIDELRAVSLVVCTRLCQATVADWGDDFACVRRVAVVTVWREWDVWWSSKQAPGDVDALRERTRRVLESDHQSAADLEWYIIDMVQKLVDVEECFH
ncbi:hypothetical protein EIP91_008392 [Steccherinum ochraceum]|uniref:DUF6535 domain-containing protein n=1 Tax=Steccherinum ochraceum TaxID=92696 RepID=A0A4R0R8L8_9APHY|nr:hypothetical protein EIP91_008392 [Steccherinum ochraceum]